jgi:hypothetical protein
MIPQKQKAYKTAFDRACRDFELSFQEEQVERAGLKFRPSPKDRGVEVPFFDETILLTIPGFRFESGRGRNVSLAAKVLVLHYLVRASGQRLSGDIVSYEDLPGCRPYLPVFEKRVCHPLITAFGFNRNLFGEACLSLRGIEEEYGNASFTLKAFPRVPITFVLWEGDQEFPPSMKVLFDRTIDGYLPLEDIAIISKLAATRILHAARLQTVDE